MRARRSQRRATSRPEGASSAYRPGRSTPSIFDHAGNANRHGRLEDFAVKELLPERKPGGVCEFSGKALKYCDACDAEVGTATNCGEPLDDGVIRKPGELVEDDVRSLLADAAAAGVIPRIAKDGSEGQSARDCRRSARDLARTATIPRRCVFAAITTPRFENGSRFAASRLARQPYNFLHIGGSIRLLTCAHIRLPGSQAWRWAGFAALGAMCCHLGGLAGVLGHPWPSVR
jgi:hypothetical protein